MLNSLPSHLPLLVAALIVVAIAAPIVRSFLDAHAFLAALRAGQEERAMVLVRTRPAAAAAALRSEATPEWIRAEASRQLATDR